jgi:hypothetical protein
MARMVNFDAIIEFFLKANEIEDTEQFFVKEAPQGAQLPQGGGGGGGPGEESMGITGEGSIDPANSPSAMISQSPETAMQRLQALAGGGQNV